MNKKLKIALRRRSSEQGFAMPVAVGLGLIMILIAVTMLVRAQGDQVTASAQKATADSLSVAETGVTRVQALLKKYPLLATKNATNWNTNADTTITTCSSGTPPTLSSGSNETAEEATLITRSNLAQWINVNNADLNEGEFRVVSYLANTPTAGLNTLNVEGRARSENDAAATATSSTVTTLGNSTTSLAVQFRLAPSASMFPAIWVRRNSGGGDPIDVSTNNSINSNVRVEGCSFDSAKVSNNNLEKLPPPNATTIKPIYDGTAPSVAANPASLPSLPALPPTGAYYRLPPIDASNCYIVLPRIVRTGGALTGTSCPATDKFGVSLSDTLNITTDTATNGVYSYLIDSTTSDTNTDNTGSAGGDSLKLSNSALIIAPPPNTKVVLYVRGNIFTSGTSSGGAPSKSCTRTSGTPETVTTYINGDSPNNFEIYGADGNGNYGTDYKTDTIEVSGSTMMNAFVYAPEATVDISQGQIKGSVWAKKFKSSNSSGCAIGLVQEDVGNLVVSLPPLPIGPVESWKRQEASP